MFDNQDNAWGTSNATGWGTDNSMDFDRHEVRVSGVPLDELRTRFNHYKKISKIIIGFIFVGIIGLVMTFIAPFILVFLEHSFKLHISNNLIIPGMPLVSFGILITGIIVYISVIGSKLKDIIKQVIESLIKQQFDVTNYDYSSSIFAPEVSKSSVFIDCTTDQAVQHFQLYPNHHYTKKISVTDTIEGKRHDIDFKFNDFELILIGGGKNNNNWHSIFKGQMYVFCLEQPVSEWLIMGHGNDGLKWATYNRNLAAEEKSDLFALSSVPKVDLQKKLDRQLEFGNDLSTLDAGKFNPEILKSSLQKLKKHLKCSYIIFMVGSYMFLFVQSERDILEVDTKPRTKRPKSKDETPFDTAVNQAQEDIDWIAGVIDIMAENKGHGLI